MKLVENKAPHKNFPTNSKYYWLNNLLGFHIPVRKSSEIVRK